MSVAMRVLLIVDSGSLCSNRRSARVFPDHDLVQIGAEQVEPILVFVCQKGKVIVQDLANS